MTEKIPSVHSMPKIFKYILGHIDRGILSATIEGPQFINMVDVQEQGDHLVMWAIVDTVRMGSKTTIEIYSAYTGDPPPGKDWTYIKTIQSQFDDLVYHLFYKIIN
jgi:hypothetical protein